MRRRDFLQAATASFAAPYFIPGSVFGANERIAVGCIGVRNQGKGNLQRFQKAGCDIVAVCDVDANVRAAAADVVDKAGGTCELYGSIPRSRRAPDRSAACGASAYRV